MHIIEGYKKPNLQSFSQMLKAVFEGQTQFLRVFG